MCMLALVRSNTSHAGAKMLLAEAVCLRDRGEALAELHA